MKLNVYLVVNEDSVVASFRTLDEACDYVRNVTIRHCVGWFPTFKSKEDTRDQIVRELKSELPHYIVRIVSVDAYEASDTPCD